MTNITPEENIKSLLLQTAEQALLSAKYTAGGASGLGLAPIEKYNLAQAAQTLTYTASRLLELHREY